MELVPVILLSVSLAFSLYAWAYHIQAEPFEVLDQTKARIHATVLEGPEEKNHKYYYKLKVTRVEEVPQLGNFTVRFSTNQALFCQPGDEVECLAGFYTFEEGGLYSAKNARLAKRNGDGRISGGIWRNLRYPCGDKKLTGHSLGGAQISAPVCRGLFPQEEASLVRAMLLGEKDGLSADVESDFRDIGASHLLVISGLHLSALAAFFSLFLSLFRLGRRVKNLLTAAAVLLFLILIGFPFSAVRSGIMLLLFLFADCLGREADSLNSLGFCPAADWSAESFFRRRCGTRPVRPFHTWNFETTARYLPSDEQALSKQKVFAPRCSAADGLSFSEFGLRARHTAGAASGVRWVFSVVAPLFAAVGAAGHLAAVYGGTGCGAFPGALARTDGHAVPALCRSAGTAAAAGCRWFGKAACALCSCEPVGSRGFLCFLGAALALCRLGGRRRTVCVSAAGMCVLVLCLACGLENRALQNGTTLAVADEGEASCVVLLQDGKAAVLSLDGYNTGAAASILKRANVREITSLRLSADSWEAAEAARRLLRKFSVKQVIRQEALYLGKELAGLMEEFLKPYFPRSFFMRPWRVWRSVLQRRGALLTFSAEGVDTAVETGED